MFVHPKGLGSLFEKHICDPFWTHFWSQKTPFSRHLVKLEGPKWGCNGLKMGSFKLFRHPKWSAIICEKAHF